MSNSKSPVKALHPWHWRHHKWAFATIVLGLLLVPFSGSVFHHIYRVIRSLPIETLMAALVQLSTWPYLVAAGLAVFLLDPAQRRALPYYVCALLLTSAATNTIKVVAGRSRPEWSVAMSEGKRLKLEQYQAANPAVPVNLAKQDYWMGFRANRPYFKDRYSSFPSGHSASAFAMAAFLVVLYPRGRFLWIGLAAGCALARVYGARHYLDDVMIGGALGWLIAFAVFSWQWPGVLARRRFCMVDSEPRSVRHTPT